MNISMKNIGKSIKLRDQIVIKMQINENKEN